MPYLTEPEPEYGQAQDLEPGLRRIVARNPGIMTYHGTNTYLIEHEGGTVVLDPGPPDEAHVSAILESCGDSIKAIMLTHYHTDHCGAVALVRASVDVPLYACAPAREYDISPDVTLADGDVAFGLDVLNTPGHAADHLCYARAPGILFSGDHVMSWSSSVVSPPLGNMLDYCRQLQRLIDRDERVFYPGHGPVLPQPSAYTAELLRFRVEREREILRMLRAGPAQPPEIVRKLYAKRDPRLFGAAERNVNAHLEKMATEGLVELGERGWEAL